MLLSNRSQRFTLLNLILIATSVALMSAALVVPFSALAQGNLPEYGIPQVGQNAGLPIGQPEPTHIIAVVVNTLLGVLGVVAVVVVLYGGFLWMTSGGNEEHVRKAKELLGGAVVGLALVFASYVIASFVIRNVSRSSGYSAGTPLQAITCLAPNACVPARQCNGTVTGDSCGDWQLECCRTQYTPPPLQGITCAQVGGTCYPDTGNYSNCPGNGRVMNTGCSSGQYCCLP